MVTRFGSIVPEGQFEIIKSIAMYENYSDADVITKAVFGPDAYAVDLERWAADTGDYWDGKPYKLDSNGNKVYDEYIPTERERINALTAELERQKASTDDLILAIVDAELGGEE